MIKTILRIIFTRWEKFFLWKERVTPVKGSPYELLRYNIHQYNGLCITLDNGSILRSGDYVLELHVSNLTIAQGKVGNITISSDLHLLPLLRQELNYLANMLKTTDFPYPVKAIWGITLFSPALRRLGFSLKPMDRGLNRKFLKGWMGFLRWLFSPKGVKSSSKSHRQPDIFYMSIPKFIQKYGN